MRVKNNTQYDTDVLQPMIDAAKAVSRDLNLDYLIVIFQTDLDNRASGHCHKAASGMIIVTLDPEVVMYNYNDGRGDFIDADEALRFVTHELRHARQLEVDMLKINAGG